MFEEELNNMDDLDQGDQDDIDGVVDIEGELRSILANLNECRYEYKRVAEMISFLRGLVNKGKKSIDEYETKLDEKIK